MKHLLIKATFIATLAISIAGAAYAEPLDVTPTNEPAAVSNETPSVQEIDRNIAIESEGFDAPETPVEAGTLGLESETHSPEVDHAAASHDGEHQTSGLPQLEPKWFASQAFWLLLTFGFLYVIFARSILPSISNTLENRHEHIQGDLDMAQKLKSEAEHVYQSYNKSLENARAKASQLFRDVEEDIKIKSERQQDDLRERLSKEMELSEARLEKTKNEALKEMDGIAAEIASAAAQKIVGISTDIDSARTVVQDLNNKAKKAA